MKLEAVRNTVIVKIEYEEKIGSIIIPDNAKQYSGDFKGRVISVGPDYKYDVKKGDRVYFYRHEGHKVIKDDETYMSLRARWLMGRDRRKGELT